MDTAKNQRKIRKIKKFGKKLITAIIFLVASYLLSLASFHIYTQLSNILFPENKGFLGFAVIGLVAGLIAVIVSSVNKRLILTVFISFFIDCLVDSIFLFPKLGIQIIQFLPGLLIGMSIVYASWHFTKRKLCLPLKNNKEQICAQYVLARKLIENPDKITLEAFKEACELLQGINPKIDAVLKKADYVSQTLTFLKGGDAIGLAIYNIKVKTEEDKEKKEKLLFFIDLVNDIREEVDAALLRVDAARAIDKIEHQNFAANSILTSSGPSGIAATGAAIIMATAVISTNAAGVGPNLQKDDFQKPIVQNSQNANAPKATVTLAPSTTPTVTPTIAPTLAITADNGWGHFTRIFSEPPIVTPLPPSTLDYTTIAIYATIRNTGTESDRLIGGASEFCKKFYIDDMTISGPSGSVPNINIPAESIVELKFWGQRLICEGASGVKHGDRIPVGLIFEKFGQVPILIEIRTTPE